VREVEKDVYRITGERRGFDPETTEKPLLAAEQAAMGTSDEPRPKSSSVRPRKRRDSAKGLRRGRLASRQHSRFN
jgi:hypothetical protein